MTAARTPRERRERAAQVAELSYRTALNQARYKDALEKARERRARAARRFAALQPLLARAGYGPHGAAPRILAEARALEARRSAVQDTRCTGPGCAVCREGRRLDAARARGDGASSYSRPEIRRGNRYTETPACSDCGYVRCQCGVAGARIPARPGTPVGAYR